MNIKIDMKLSEFIEALPDLLIAWRRAEVPVKAQAARALGLKNRQGIDEREKKLPNAQLGSILEYIEMLEKESKNSPTIIIVPIKSLTEKTSDDVD